MVGRRLHTGLARDEDHPTMTALDHPRGVVPCEADAGEHVDLEHPPPPVIVDIEGRLGLEDAYVVDQDVDTRHLVEDLLRSSTRADVAATMPCALSCAATVSTSAAPIRSHPRQVAS